MTNENDPATGSDPAGATPDDDQLGDGGRKALDAERRARRDAERRARDLQSRVTELETADVRREVAADKGLTPAQAKRLSGSTREELEADADELLETFGTDTTGGSRPPSRKPSDDLRGGLNPGGDMDPNAKAIADRVFGNGL